MEQTNNSLKYVQVSDVYGILYNLAIHFIVR